MLPKVSAAISRLIEPISSTGLSRLPRERNPDSGGHPGKKKDTPKEPEKRLATVTPIRSTQGSPELMRPVALALHALRQGAAASVNRLKGWGSYARTLLQSKKTKSGTVKGLIVDRRVE